MYALTQSIKETVTPQPGTVPRPQKPLRSSSIRQEPLRFSRVYRHAQFHATTRIPYQPSALGGHISSILYIKWTKKVTSNEYNRVNNTRNHCILNVCYFIHPYFGEIISLNIKSNHAHFHSRKYIRRCRLQNGRHVVWALSVFVYCCIIHRYAAGVFVQHYAQANAKMTKLHITVPL